MRGGREEGEAESRKRGERENEERMKRGRK